MELNNSKKQTGTLVQTQLFAEGSLDHASHLAKPVRERERKMTATSGQKCLESLEKFSRPTLWQKMFMEYIIKNPAWYSKHCVLKWRIRGTKSNRLLFQLVPSELRSVETEYGLLGTFPSPAASDSRAIKNFRADSNIMEGGKHSISLTHFIAYRQPNIGAVNPRLVEGLMGYPENWLNLTDSVMQSTPK